MLLKELSFNFERCNALAGCQELFEWAARSELEVLTISKAPLEASDLWIVASDEAASHSHQQNVEHQENRWNEDQSAGALHIWELIDREERGQREKEGQWDECSHLDLKSKEEWDDWAKLTDEHACIVDSLPLGKLFQEQSWQEEDQSRDCQIEHAHVAIVFHDTLSQGSSQLFDPVELLFSVFAHNMQPDSADLAILLIKYDLGLHLNYWIRRWFNLWHGLSQGWD